MKNIFKYIGILTICLISFYYTEKVALYIKSINPVMIELKNNRESLEVASIDCTLVDNIHIIPGLNGKKINLNASLSKMNNTYDESKIVFYSYAPSISLKDNQNKIIIRGNKEKNNVSLIFNNSNTISTYLINKNYQIDLLITEEKYNKSYELINYSNHEDTYNNIEHFLNKNKLNTKICFTKTDTIPKLCKNKYIIKPSLTLNHSNFNTNITKITNGEIILIESINSEQIELLLNYLTSKRIEITYLSNLIKEER